jgi:hypothetical protein
VGAWINYLTNFLIIFFFFKKKPIPEATAFAGLNVAPPLHAAMTLYLNAWLIIGQNTISTIN